MLRKTGFSAPIRVYWELVPDARGGLAEADALRVAHELAALRVFFVTLRLGAGPRDDIGGLAGALKAGGVRVTVSVADAASLPDASGLAGADALELSPRSAVGFGELLSVIKDRGAAPPLSVSVVPARGNAGLIEDVFRRALDAGIRSFGLPNPDVVSGFHSAPEYVLDRESRAALKEALERLLAPHGDAVKLVVHDLFLHKALELPGLGPRVEYAGCQAGEAVAYISGAGEAYPCSTWPVPLGSLRGTSFAEIWSGELRGRVREAAMTLPDECAGCPDAPECKGGCPGLAVAVGRPGCKDPGCDI